jgi:cytochrome c
MTAKLRSAVLKLVVVGVAAVAPFPVQSAQHAAPSQGGGGAEGERSGMMSGEMMGNQPSAGLLMPMMNPARGRELFASKGCVVCHSVNGVGGEDAAPLDASTMDMPMNPFEFAARMWRGAEAMIYLQQEELGEQIEFTGAELADMIAFVHSPQEQLKFSEADIPPRIKDLMRHMKEEEPHEQEEGHEADRAAD